jgi:hypothetical protein
MQLVGAVIRTPSGSGSTANREVGLIWNFSRPLSVRISWHCFQYIQTLETVQKSFIPMKLSLFPWNSYHLSFSLIWCHISIINAHETQMKPHWNWPHDACAIFSRSPTLHGMLPCRASCRGPLLTATPTSTRQLVVACLDIHCWCHHHLH